MSIVKNIIAYLKRNWKRIVIWLVSFIFGGFFLLSAAGWLLATYYGMKGVFGPKSTEFLHSLNIFDHIIRTSQVLLVIAASIALLIQRKIAVKLYLVNLIVSIICITAIGKWGITFLKPISVIVVYAYSYWINRLGYLK
jgi:hypothetical protein